MDVKQAKLRQEFNNKDAIRHFCGEKLNGATDEFSKEIALTKTGKTNKSNYNSIFFPIEKFAEIIAIENGKTLQEKEARFKYVKSLQEKLTTESSDLAGAVQTDVLTELMGLVLRDGSIIGDLQPTIKFLTNQVDFPVLSHSAHTVWHTEGDSTTLTEESLSSSEKNLTFKTLVNKTSVSRKAMRVVKFDAVMESIGEASKQISEEISKAIFYGNPSNGEPKGIDRYTANGEVVRINVNSDATRNVRFFPQDNFLSELFGRVERNFKNTNSREQQNKKIIFSPELFNNSFFVQIAGALKNVNSPVGIGGGKVYGTRVKDYPFAFFMENIPMFQYSAIPEPSNNGQTFMFYGDFREVVIGFFSDTVEVRLDEDVDLGGMVIRCFFDCDVVIRRPSFFGKLAFSSI